MKYLILFILTFIISCDYKSDEEIQAEYNRKLMEKINIIRDQSLTDKIYNFQWGEFSFKIKQEQYENKYIDSHPVALDFVYNQLLKKIVECRSEIFKDKEMAKLEVYRNIECPILKEIFENKIQNFDKFVSEDIQEVYYFNVSKDLSLYSFLTNGYVASSETFVDGHDVSKATTVGLFKSESECLTYLDKYLNSGVFLVGKCRGYKDEFSKLKRYEITNKSVTETIKELETEFEVKR